MDDQEFFVSQIVKMGQAFAYGWENPESHFVLDLLPPESIANLLTALLAEGFPSRKQNQQEQKEKWFQEIFHGVYSGDSQRMHPRQQYPRKNEKGAVDKKGFICFDPLIKY
jgi:hypothetical protein